LAGLQYILTLVYRKEKKAMKKLIVLILSLALLAGVGSVALANPTDTEGSIRFRDGFVIINPPPEPPANDCFCCPPCHTRNAGNGDCDCDDPPGTIDANCPCPCTCGTPYDRFFREKRVANDLYFGEHQLTIFGTFDSANRAGSPQENEDRYTTRTGEYTGVEVINQSPDEAHIGVEISPFTVDGPSGPVTLAGSTLKLLEAGAAEKGGGTPSFQGDGITLTGASQRILAVGSAREVRAAWSGELLTLVGTSRPGRAQAALTWTETVGP